MFLSAAMYLAFDPAAFLNVAKGLVVAFLFVVIGFHLASAAGFGRIQKALVVVAVGVLAYMAISGTLLQDAANWAKSNGLG